MKQKIIQITDIERLRSLKLNRAEREWLLVQQQVLAATSKLADAVDAEKGLSHEYEDLRRNLFKPDVGQMSGQGLKSRVGELDFLEQLTQAQQSVVVELRQQHAETLQLQGQAEQHVQQCHAQLQAIQLQSSLLRKQFKKAQMQRAETDIEELFVQRLSSQKSAAE